MHIDLTFIGNATNPPEKLFDDIPKEDMTVIHGNKWYVHAMGLEFLDTMKYD